jgi:hypothetical protein
MPNVQAAARNLHRVHRSSFANQRARGLHSNPFSFFEEFNHSRAERVVRDFEKHNSSNALALSEYVKALVSVELQAKGSHRFPFTHLF